MNYYPENPDFIKCLDSIPNVQNILRDLNINNFYIPQINFEQENTLFFYVPPIIPQKYLAIFDIDWTVTYSEETLFPIREHDIHILPQRKEILTKLFKLGYTIIFITNQKAKTKSTIKKKCNRIANFLQKLNLPCYAFIATGGDGDKFRKPNIGIWTKINQLIPDIKYAFFVGDALGRAKDFGDSDKMFAVNAGIRDIYSPEEFFPIDKFIIEPGKNMVIVVGMPGVGKSTFINKNLVPEGFYHISRDELKITTQENFAKAVNAIAKTDVPNIVVDATNLTLEIREDFYKIARKYKYNITVLYFVRDAYGWNTLRTKPIEKWAYFRHYNKFIPPSTEKDKQKIVLINNF